MKRVKSNYHTLHVLKSTHSKLRKAIITNCNKEHVNSISECILKVLNGNVKLSGCSTRNLRKYKALLRNVADKRVQEEADCLTGRIPAPSAERRSASDR